jgi:hypothetical protein
MQQEQPGRVGRRLAAIVAADVAGYSRLMGLDEVGTARTRGARPYRARNLRNAEPRFYTAWTRSGHRTAPTGLFD